MWREELFDLLKLVTQKGGDSHFEWLEMTQRTGGSRSQTAHAQGKFGAGFLSFKTANRRWAAFTNDIVTWLCSVGALDTNISNDL